MKVVHKDAAVTAPHDDQFPGTFEAILSAPTKDRDGDTLLPSEWKQPLPEHIVVDMDHEMTVAGTIGSAKPWIDEKGNLRISGRFASTPKAQEVRTLMQEGHINRTSVAFMSERTQKDGVTTVARELLNAAVVAIPSNREAVVLSAKGLKAGSRNSQSDQAHLDSIYDHVVALGAVGTQEEGSTTEDPADVKQFTVKQAAELLERANLAPDLSAALAVLARASGYNKPLDGTVRVSGEDADSGVSGPSAAGAVEAPAADGKGAPDDADRIEQEARAARFRLYNILSGRN